MAFFSRSTTRAFFIVAFFMCSFNAIASDDAYLKMLEGEAEDVQLDQSGQISNTDELDAKDDISAKDWKWEGDLEGDSVPKGLSQAQFASLLKQHFYGTYVFYRKLSSVDRRTVHYHYSQSPAATLDSVRQDILSHLKN